MPKPRAMRSMLSRFSLVVFMGTVVRNSAFMNAYPGRNSTKMIPRTFRRYAAG
jgi:hypothetical protein